MEGELPGLYKIKVIHKKDELTSELLGAFNPDYVFFPHWSFMIDKSIFETYRCIVFHMTDLPYGRGGSPLQNLIVRGHVKTKISAIDVVEKVDAGDIYLKSDLDLSGNAKDIFYRAQVVIESMIKEIIHKDISPVPQLGDPVFFKRRRSSESDMSNLEDLEKVYDYIRMLDSPGYPKAFLETSNFRLEFANSSYNKDMIEAHVRIFKK